MPAKIIALLLCLLAAVPAISQTVDEPNPTEDLAELRKEAIAFLRETMSDINTMRSLENRISFTAELAGLMWFHDEREARAMYSALIGDFRQLMMQYDAQMNAYGVEASDLNRHGGIMSMGDPTEQQRIARRFAMAMMVRQQIAMSIAEHDAELAFGFYDDSLSAISNPEFRKQAAERDSYFEQQLVSRVADKDPAKATQFAVKALGSGIGYYNVEILKKIYSKDPAKGAEYGTAMLGKVKGDKVDSSKFWILNSLLEFGAKTLEDSRKKGGKPPALTEPQLRELADAFGQAILSQPMGSAEGMQYATAIGRYAPGRATQIRAKLRTGTGSNRGYAYGSNVTANAANVAANAVMTSNMNTASSAGYDPEMLAKEEEKAQLEEAMKSGLGKLPKEERERIVMTARSEIMKQQGRIQKVTALGMLAAQVAGAGDNQLAAEIMRDAEYMVNPAPKSSQDYLLSWMLASGYANTDRDRAFIILEETIGRANDTISAFVKVGEFMDVAEEMIIDGEVQVGAFGGQMVSGLTKQLGMADVTIKVLANADFAKTKHLTNRFERPEVRILAKMMVLRAVLEKNTPKQTNEEGEMDDVTSEY
jgi:hypothetical protein